MESDTEGTTDEDECNCCGTQRFECDEHVGVSRGGRLSRETPAEECDEVA